MHLRLRAGHIFRLDDLVKAMLITSANDACLAAAIHVGGSEDKFVDLMNAKARALGLLHTHFSNACGFDSPTHYTTAQDLVSLTELALQHPLFRSYVKEERGILTAVNTNAFVIFCARQIDFSVGCQESKGLKPALRRRRGDA